GAPIERTSHRWLARRESPLREDIAWLEELAQAPASDQPAMAVSARREPFATALAERRTDAWSFGAVRLKLEGVLQAGLLDQHELRLEEVHAALLALQNLRQELTGGVVADRFAGGDGRAEIGDPLVLELQVAVENLLDVLADQQLVQVLQVRQALQ